MLVIALAIFSALILAAISNLYHPKPRIIAYVGELQSSTLIQLARVYIASRSSGNNSVDINNAIMRLLSLNRTYNLGLPNITYDDFRVDWIIQLGNESGYGVYCLVFNLRYRYFNCSVACNVSWEYTLRNVYYKELNGVVHKYMNYTLIYRHNYTAPQWGYVLLTPCLYVYNNTFDLKYLGSGLWAVGVPANETMALVDEYGITIFVGGGGG